MNPFRGLKGWYAMEGNPDDSGPEHHAGTNVGGMAYGPGKIGRCGVFNGTDSYIRLDTTVCPVTKTLPFSMAAWVKPEPMTDYGTIAANSHYDNTFGYQFCLDKDGKVGLYWSWGDWWDGGLTTTDVAPNSVWTHVAATFNGDYPIAGLRLYVNAVSCPFARDFLVGCGDVIGNYDSVIGCFLYYGYTPTQMFKGSIDEVVFADRALSDQEIYQLYIGGTPME